MSKHRNPQARLSKQAPADNFNPGLAIERLYRELVEVEALAIAADEAVTMLPPYPSGKHKRILARLFTLVTKTADQASQALEKSEDMIAQLAAHMAARAAKQQPRKRRAA
jgi:hypothetical protein